MKVTLIPILTVALGKVTTGLIRWQEDLEIRGQVTTIQTTALDQQEYKEKSWTLEVSWRHSNSNERLSANAVLKNSQVSKIILTLILSLLWFLFFLFIFFIAISHICLIGAYMYVPKKSRTCLPTFSKWQYHNVTVICKLVMFEVTC